MPAPEQTPTEEGLQQTTQESSTSPGMETEATAITILASVKEQVFFNLLDIYLSETSYGEIKYLKCFGIDRSIDH